MFLTEKWQLKYQICGILGKRFVFSLQLKWIELA